MKSSIVRLRTRRKAIQRLDNLFDADSSVFVIHYSCESFYNLPEGFTARITSIAVMKLDDRQTISFSIPQVAERNHIEGSQIEELYAFLEKELLEEFYNFIKPYHQNGFTWLHWNMRNAQYGFEALEHRYKVLDGDPVVILQSQRLDLSQIVRDIYGRDYIGKPHLFNLIKRNALLVNDILSGEDEAKAFENGEYMRMHQSTLSKVHAIGSIARLSYEGGLKTDAHPAAVYGWWLTAMIEGVTDHWLFKFLGFIALLITFISFVIQLSGN